MGYNQPDPYNQPEHYGLEVIGSIDWNEEPYEFDMTALWRHRESRRFYISSDSGRSCSSPFEDLESADVAEVISQLEHVPSLSWLNTTLDGINAGSSHRQRYDQAQILRCGSEIHGLLDRARKMGLA